MAKNLLSTGILLCQVHHLAMWTKQEYEDQLWWQQTMSILVIHKRVTVPSSLQGTLFLLCTTARNEFS